MQVCNPSGRPASGAARDRRSRPAVRIALVVLCLASVGLHAQQQSPARNQSPATVQAPGGREIQGQVSDERGGFIAGATVVLTDAAGNAVTTTTGAAGRFTFAGTDPGTYSVRVSAENFAAYEAADFVVRAEGENVLNVTLKIATRREAITVFSTTGFTRGAEFRGSTMIIQGDALEALPDGPGGLRAAIRALAVRSSGPFGPQILVNGFEGNRLPPKSSIREIRINDNPFSAEYAQLGLGRVEVLTKPGSDKFRSQVYFNFGDEALNSRNPFAPTRANFQTRAAGANLSGPILRNRLSFFADYVRETTDSNSVVNATIIDPFFRIQPFGLVLLTPQRQVDTSPRLDYQINRSNTLTLQYNYTRSDSQNDAVGELVLPSRAQGLGTRTQSLQLTETAVITPRVLNETRLQASRNHVTQTGDNSTPTIRVPGSFIGGGAELGHSFNRQERLQLDNITSWQLGRHLVKAGIQVRYARLAVGSDRNFGGTYTFGGRLAPQLDEHGEIVFGPDGQPLLVEISNIEAHRRTLLFQNRGLSPAEIRERGGGPLQFSITAGQPRTDLRQYEAGAFLQDDWRVHPKFSLDAGLRFERQSNIDTPLNVAPRIGFTWNAGPRNEPKTVVRGGVGLFYERVTDQIVLRTRQLSGLTQVQYITGDPGVLDLFPQLPSREQLEGFATQPSIVRLGAGVRPAYTVHSSISVERELPRGFSAAVTYSDIRTRHMLRSRNINAPLPAAGLDLGPKPFPDQGNIFEYESTGVFNGRQLLVNLTYYPGKRISLWASYTYSDSKSNTDGPDTFPASSYNLRQDYGRSSLNAVHSVYWGGWINAFWGIELVPLGVWRSGLPFDVTTGRDNNGDSLFTDRPAFASDLNRPGVVVNRYGAFDLNPAPGQALIPRNYLFGPSFLAVNLQTRKTFRIADRGSLTVSVQAQNIFNHTNPGLPVGNLSSQFFGVSRSSAGDWGFGSNQAGNRRVEGTVSLGF